MKLYQKLLPSLELKRMQLTAESNKARDQLDAAVQAERDLNAAIVRELPMVADQEIDLSGLVKIAEVKLGQENVVGVKLPVLERLTFEVFPYSLLARPHWVDALVNRLQETVRRRLEAQVAAARVQALERAVRRITQRVNLFEKILIPTAKKNIQRIQIFLGDAERSAVVRSKLAKAINQKKRQAFFEEGAQA